MSIAKALGCAPKDGARPRSSMGFYRTEWECTVALLKREADVLLRRGKVWECCAGAGHMVRVLESWGLRVAASDPVDRGINATLKRFGDFEEPMGSSIVTNPPFGGNIPEKIVLGALRMNVSYVALLLPAAFPNADKRIRLWKRWRPAAIYPLAWRPDWTGGGNSPMPMSWFIWDAERSGLSMEILPRPDDDEKPPVSNAPFLPLVSRPHQ